MRNCEDSLIDILSGFSSQLLVEKPATVVQVHNQYCVDIEYYDNGTIGTLPRVPVKHLQTSNAFVFLKLKKGDRGTVRFFDNDIDHYKNSDYGASPDDRGHDLNDNYYDLGFVPDKEQYIMPDAEICIGLKNQTALIEFTGSGNIVMKAANLTVSGSNVKITGSNVELGSNTKIDGKVFLSHTHSGGHDGNPTGGVI